MAVVKDSVARILLCGCFIHATLIPSTAKGLGDSDDPDGMEGCSRLSTNDFSGCDELIFGFRLTYVYWLVNRTQIAIPDFIPQPTSTCRTQVYYPLPSSFAPAHS